MAYRYRIHELAHEEYISAYEWYQLKQSGLETRFMNCVEKRLQQISEHPEYFSKRQGNYRIAKVENFPYYIVYEFFKRKLLIHIAAIYHGKRHPKRKFRKIK
jgi:plasmid stabilization system protein ParE